MRVSPEMQPRPPVNHMSVYFWSRKSFQAPQKLGANMSLSEIVAMSGCGLEVGDSVVLQGDYEFRLLLVEKERLVEHGVALGYGTEPM